MEEKGREIFKAIEDGFLPFTSWPRRAASWRSEIIILYRDINLILEIQPLGNGKFTLKLVNLHRTGSTRVPPPNIQRASLRAGSEPTQHAALRAELFALRPTLLAKRAREAGADEAKVEWALDFSTDPKGELIELIVQLVPSADEEEEGDPAAESAPSEPGDGAILVALVVLYVNSIIGDKLENWVGELSDWWRDKDRICCGINQCQTSPPCPGLILPPWEITYREWWHAGGMAKMMEISSEKRTMAIQEDKDERKNNARERGEVIDATCAKHRSGCNNERYTEACTGISGKWDTFVINNELFLEWSQELLTSKGIDWEELVGGEVKSHAPDVTTTAGGVSSAMGGGNKGHPKKRKSKKSRKSKRNKSKKRRSKRMRSKRR